MRRAGLMGGLLAIVVGGCTTITGSGRPPETLNQTSVTYGTHAIVGTCPSEPAETLSIGAAIGASVISQGVNRIGAAIKAAAGPETRQVLVRRNVELSNREPFGPCLMVARGWFHEDLKDIGKYEETSGAEFEYKTDISDIQRQGLLLATTPDFFFEGKIVGSNDGSASTVTPVYAHLRNPIATSFLRRSKARSILLSFSITAPDKTADLNKGQGSTVVIGKLVPGHAKVFPTETQLIFEAKCTDNKKCSDTEFAQRMRSVYESEWFSLPLSDKPKPMTLQVLVSETRGASAFLQLVSDVFSDVQKDLIAELQQSLIPSVGGAAEETETAAEEAIANGYDNAYASAIVKLTACVAASTDASKIAEAKVAMRSLNQASRKAGKNELFKESDIDQLAFRTNALLPCQNALDKLST